MQNYPSIENWRGLGDPKHFDGNCRHTSRSLSKYGMRPLADVYFMNFMSSVQFLSNKGSVISLFDQIQISKSSIQIYRIQSQTCVQIPPSTFTTISIET